MASEILVLGSKGRMGRRYCAILKSLSVPCDEWDKADGTPAPRLAEYRRVIVATPTETHYDILRQCIDDSVQYVLCEKPLCMSSEKCAGLAGLAERDMRVVCNWSYVLPWRLYPGKHNVMYGNWYTGPHGEAWDCCQLHYLDRNTQAFVGRGPSFEATIDGWSISLTDIDRSYVAMIRDWLEEPRHLWGLSDAYQMERKVERLCKPQ